MKEKTTEPVDLANDPRYKWHGLFRLHSWWLSIDNRVFVITKLSHHDDGNIKYITLLEQNKEEPIKRPFEEVAKLFIAGKFECTSKMPA